MADTPLFNFRVGAHRGAPHERARAPKTPDVSQAAADDPDVTPDFQTLTVPPDPNLDPTLDDPDEEDGVIIRTRRAAPPLLIEALRLQATVRRARAQTEQTPLDHFRLDAAIARGAAHFVDLLAVKSLQEEIGNIILSEDGFALIASGLDAGDRPPEPHYLHRIKAVIDDQELQEVVLYTEDEEGERTDHPEASAQRPRYLSKYNEQFGPYESPHCDKVAEVNRKLDPAYWFLDNATREFYEIALTLSSLPDKPAAYRPRPVRFPLFRPLRGIAERTLEARHNSKQPSVDPSELELTQRVVAWYQHKGLNQVKEQEQIKAKGSILTSAQERMRPLLARDNELHYLKLEQDIDDERTEANIESYLTLTRQDRVFIGNICTHSSPEEAYIFARSLDLERVRDIRRALEEYARNGTIPVSEVTPRLHEYIMESFREALDEEQETHGD